MESANSEEKTVYFPEKIEGCKSCLRNGCLIYYRDMEIVKNCPCYSCLVKAMCTIVCKERSVFFRKLLNNNYIFRFGEEKKKENDNTMQELHM
jgi:hypothetical protein